MPRFSIVVPVYGTAAYLPACLDSLLAQSLEDWEAVVVVDASPDDSLAIARDYASRDSRFIVVNKEVNEGLHLARKTGVEKVRGDYTFFLDSDDELAPEFCAQLAGQLDGGEVDVLHFGLTVVGDNGVDEDECLAFESFNNADVPPAGGEDIVRDIFDPERGYKVDWRVTQRVFRSDLARRGFGLMTGDRLERAEDGYECLVLSAIAVSSRASKNIRGYIYHYGRGVTGTSAISAVRFGAFCEQFLACFEAADAFADAWSALDVHPCARGFAEKATELLANDWNTRVDPSERLQAGELMARAMGPAVAAREAWRFVRDLAWRQYQDDASPAEVESLGLWLPVARRFSNEALAVGDGANERLVETRARAEELMDETRRRELFKTYDAQDVRIFVSTHKPVDLFDSAVLQPVQVGCALRDYKFPWALHDDAGENISEQNPMYCELTTQYWAWKNVDAEYYGFCHYRRYFDFSSERHEENEWGEIMDDYISPSTQRRYALDDENILAAVEGYDVITTEFKNLSDFPGTNDTPYKQYKAAPRLHLADLERVISILKDMHPDYAEDADAFLKGGHSCFCNMFIMRKQAFQDYCAWLFPVLERFVAETDMNHYSVEALRTPGHLSERLFNIYYNHQMRAGADWKTKQLQCVHFNHPERIEPLGEPSADHPVVPVVFAADNNYVPMLTTTISSMLRNANPERFYDVVVLTRDISGDNRAEMSTYLEALAPHVKLRFHNVAPVIDRYDLATSNEHISVETYYRFLVPSVLPFYDKVLYLDSDLIVEGDVAELFDTELGDNLLGAVSDVDYLGNLNMSDGARLAYTNKVLKMADPYRYFQAGVLLLNTHAMREAYSTEQWLQFASAPDYIYDDQDVLNAHCEGRVRYLDPSWNVMHDCGARVGNVFSFAPAKTYQTYLAARSNPRIRHYAGFEKPWNTAGCDWAEHYWRYARETPFYERLLTTLSGTGRKALEKPLPPKALSPKNPIRKVIDPIMPVGSHRREVAKAIGRKIKGLE